jgi:hypothetical protein
VERVQGELRLGTPCACMAAGGRGPPCPGSWRLSACPHLQCRRAHMCDIDDTHSDRAQRSRPERRSMSHQGVALVGAGGGGGGVQA